MTKGQTLKTPLAVAPECLQHLQKQETQEITAEAKPDQGFEDKARLLPEKVREIIVHDEASFERMGRAKVYCKTIRLGIIEDFKEMKAAANTAVQKIREREKKALEPVLEAEAHANEQIGAWTTKLRIEREEAEEKERARIKAEEEKEEALFQKALKAENEGKKEEAREIIETPAAPEVPKIYIPPKQKTKDFHTREHWEYEVINRNDIPAEFWILDLQKLGSVVREKKGNASIPGIRVFRKDIVV